MSAKSRPLNSTFAGAFGRRALRDAAAGWRGAAVRIELPDGGRIAFGAPTSDAAVLRLNNYRALRRALIGGDLGFAQGYLDGDWDAPGLPALLTAFASHFERLGGLANGNRLHRLLQRRLRILQANSLAGARRNIEAHYDLGNAFYAAWLDPGMSYSSALFDEPHDTLEAAQTRKYAALAEAIDLRRGHSVLEIGCGWGGFAEYASREIGANVTAITISPAQYAYAKARISAAGLADRVKVNLCDYRQTEGQFDRVISIEMFEAVGERYWPTFFRSLRARLAPGGRAGLQVITIADELFEDYRRRIDFIQAYVFPGGMLPSEREFSQAASRAGLVCSAIRRFGADYAHTLRVWTERFEAAWPDLRRRGVDERFRRLWRFYLAYCEAGFSTGRTDVAHLVLTPI